MDTFALLLFARTCIDHISITGTTRAVHKAIFTFVLCAAVAALAVVICCRRRWHGCRLLLRLLRHHVSAFGGPSAAGCRALLIILREWERESLQLWMNRKQWTRNEPEYIHGIVLSHTIILENVHVHLVCTNSPATPWYNSPRSLSHAQHTQKKTHEGGNAAVRLSPNTNRRLCSSSSAIVVVRIVVVVGRIQHDDSGSCGGTAPFGWRHADNSRKIESVARARKHTKMQTLRLLGWLGDDVLAINDGFRRIRGALNYACFTGVLCVIYIHIHINMCTSYVCVRQYIRIVCASELWLCQNTPHQLYMRSNTKYSRNWARTEVIRVRRHFTTLFMATLLSVWIDSFGSDEPHLLCSSRNPGTE